MSEVGRAASEFLETIPAFSAAALQEDDVLHVALQVVLLNPSYQTRPGKGSIHKFSSRSMVH